MTTTMTLKPPPPGPPIVFAATNCRLWYKHPNGIEEFWLADIKAVRSGLFSRVFSDVIFVETPGRIAWLLGIVTPNDVHQLRNDPETEEQAEFIEFLQTENARDTATLGRLVEFFRSRDYATVGKATAAYMAARALTHAFGVGFVDRQGQYQLLEIVPGAESGFDGACYVP